MVNRDAIKVLGLNTTVYCAELLNIYKKAVLKNKLINESYFKIDRKYITTQTSLSNDEQLKCDVKLAKVKIIEVDSTDVDIVKFNVELFASILASEDIQLLNKVSEKVKKGVKGVNEEVKAKNRDRIILTLKESIKCNTYLVLVALRDWIDAVMSNPQKYLSAPQVEIFKNKIDDYCNGDVKKALAVIKIATVHQYIDCQWAINAYEKDLIVKNSIPTSTVTQLSTNRPRVTMQKRTEKQDLGDQVF